jgi:hypothetical protein
LLPSSLSVLSSSAANDLCALYRSRCIAVQCCRLRIPHQDRRGPRCARTVQAFFFSFCCCPLDHTCPLHRLNRPADGYAAEVLGRRCACFLPQPLRCLPFGLPRLRRAQLRDASPAGKNMVGRGEAGRSPKPPRPPGRSTSMSYEKFREPCSAIPTERGPPFNRP